MGQAFIKLGIWMQKIWCRFQSSWNSLILYLTFKDVTCPNKMCECNTQKTYVKKKS